MKSNSHPKQKLYNNLFTAANKFIRDGDIPSALNRAREGFELGFELNRNECAGQYLFCLNKLGRFDEAVKATDRFAAQAVETDNYSSLRFDETILSNALCAILSFGPEKASKGLSLLKKSGRASVKNWRSHFANLDYNPSQTSLIFNTALILLYAGQKTNALKLLKEVMEHLMFVMDSKNIDAEVIDEFMHLISEIPEFAPLLEEDIWDELAETIENNLETT